MVFRPGDPLLQDFGQGTLPYSDGDTWEPHAYNKATAPGSNTLTLLNFHSISSILTASLADLYGPHDDFYTTWLGRSQRLAQDPVP